MQSIYKVICFVLNNLKLVYGNIKVRPKDKEQLVAMKAVLKAFKIDFKIEKRMDETERILANPTMVKRLEESIQQIKDGKGIKVSFDEVWNLR